MDLCRKIQNAFVKNLAQFSLKRPLLTHEAAQSQDTFLLLVPSCSHLQSVLWAVSIPVSVWASVF